MTDGPQTKLQYRQLRSFVLCSSFGLLLACLGTGCGASVGTRKADLGTDSAGGAERDSDLRAEQRRLAIGEASDRAFEPLRRGPIPELRLALRPEHEQQLRENPRRYVRAGLRENENDSFPAVGLKLKGAAGSFRDFDDKPAMTIKMSRFEDSLRFHGMDKWHLNNSVQDESYLCELVASQICREAGIPAPRVAHARVWLNDRDLGFYVIKEGFDEVFL
ncbi:MAG: hypothetical protein RIS70_3264, partial [Planctomycetota bacterium]